MYTLVFFGFRLDTWLAVLPKEGVYPILILTVKLSISLHKLTRFSCESKAVLFELAFLISAH
jgi:hypothetical protein